MISVKRVLEIFQNPRAKTIEAIDASVAEFRRTDQFLVDQRMRDRLRAQEALERHREQSAMGNLRRTSE